MPKGQLDINGYDAFERYGMSMDSAALSALMTPAGNKENLHTVSRVMHGQRVSKNVVRKASRQLTIVFQICAKSEEDFFAKYELFCEEVLDKGFMTITTSFQKKSYRVEYNACQQFAQYMRGIAKFTLKLTENDPTDRDLIYTISTWDGFELRNNNNGSVGTSVGKCQENGTIKYEMGGSVDRNGFFVRVRPIAKYDGNDIDPEVSMYIVNKYGEHMIPAAGPYRNYMQFMADRNVPIDGNGDNLIRMDAKCGSVVKLSLSFHLVGELKDAGVDIGGGEFKPLSDEN